MRYPHRGVSLNESGRSDSSCTKVEVVTELKYGSVYVYKQMTAECVEKASTLPDCTLTARGGPVGPDVQLL
jgi:hypothetical protein